MPIARVGSEELRNEMDPVMRPLWMWHAVEETEHKAAALRRAIDLATGRPAPAAQPVPAGGGGDRP